LRAEVAFAVLVLAATATLERAAPPATIAGGPVVRELDLGPMRLQMDIRPATSGPTTTTCTCSAGAAGRRSSASNSSP